MKKFTSFLLTTLCVVSAVAQSYSAVEGTLSWAVGNEEQATISDDIAAAVSATAYSYGSDLSVTTASYSDVNSGTLVKYTPGTSNAGCVESVMIKYYIKLKAGLTFTPTQLSYDAVKVGTDGAYFSIGYAYDGTATTAEAVPYAEILRNNNANASDASLNHVVALDDTQSVNTFEVRFYISNTANNKNMAIGNIVISGTVSGEEQAVSQYSLSALTNIDGAGTVSISPNTTVYDEGAEVKLTATKNFGYNFVNWTDDSGNDLGSESTITVTMNANQTITANFVAVNTYSLNISVLGANDYEVQASPEGTTVGGEQMYEEGTTVTLTASSNEIVTFNNWSDGQTSSSISFAMTQDVDITATYSAIDFVAAWDFYNSGNNGRVADYYSEGNDAAALALRTEAGATTSWLDKSTVSAGGYEGRPAAVNWTKTGLGAYYWQTKVDASNFTNIQIISAMTLNYNAYSTQNVEYSLDGENWTLAGTIVIPSAKTWVDSQLALPEAVNNASALYIRWKSDTSSSTLGTTSDNDGIALGAIYIIGDEAAVYDADAPVLVSQVPENEANSASITGKIVLTFDKKIQLTETSSAVLGVSGATDSSELSGSVSGKSVTFEYKNLNYSTAYQFTLAKGSIANLSDVAFAEDIVINFTTRTRPEVTKKLYDAVVSTADELAAALDAAAARTSTSERYRIFIRNGNYVMPLRTTATKTGTDGTPYADQTTYINTPNVSLIGESMDGVVITSGITQTFVSGANVLEGLGSADVINLKSSATETYMQDLTIKGAIGDGTGREAVLHDQSDKTVCKDVCLYSYQDTYYSHNSSSRFYFEGGVIRGRTDYLCGSGDVFYNGVTLQICASGGYISAPSTPLQYGYVFSDCQIAAEDGVSGLDGNFTLGRPWGQGTPSALFVNTLMSIKPSATGWSEMSGGYPKRFAEYNSVTSSGTVIDLSDRKTIFADTYTNDPVLTADEAAELTIGNVMGGSDDWDPAALAEQAPLPADVELDGLTLTWTGSDYALLYAIVQDGSVVDFTTETSYTISDAASTYAVRAANEMGGLGEAVVANATTAEGNAIDSQTSCATVDYVDYFTLRGVRLSAPPRGLNVVRATLSDGTINVSRVLVK